VTLRAGRDAAMQFSRYRAGCARLLARQAEVTDVYGLGRIAEVIDLRHATHAPARNAGDEICNAGVAFPPVLVRVAPAFQPRQQLGVYRVAYVPDLVRLSAEHAQHVGLRLVGIRQGGAVAHAHHLRAAVLVVSFEPGDVFEIFRIGRIGDV